MNLPHDHPVDDFDPNAAAEHDNLYPDCPATKIPKRQQTWRGDTNLFDMIVSLYRTHLMVDDCWYSCPQSADGCCDSDQGNDCNCGGATANARIDEILDFVEDML